MATRSRNSRKSRLESAASDPFAAAPQLNDRVLNARPDVTDLRDRIYEPPLLDLALRLDPPEPELSPVRDQGREGACTGFALASAITLMNRIRFRAQGHDEIPPASSARMLYEMAKLHDEWPGEDYEGSSIRGALKGFYNNGVCSAAKAPYRDGDRSWFLTVDRAREARQVGLGAYYRLRPEIIDYHAALNQAGVIYVSAQVHRGWQRPSGGRIRPSHLTEGGHAFIIVGYDEEGFIIQNSWGAQWGGFAGREGLAHWRYDDWATHVMDAWVLRLAVPTPAAFDLTVTEPRAETEALFGDKDVRAPRHEDIIGHVIHLDDGQLKDSGAYPTPITTIRETARLLSDQSWSGHDKYAHLLLYAHGGLNTGAASANRVRKMKDVFKRNGIYPVHFMWETGFFETLGDVILGARDKAGARVGFGSEFFDRMIETVARRPGRAIWRDMKRDAEQSFRPGGGGRQAVKVLLEGNARRARPLQLHLVGHSAGAILLAHLLAALDGMKTPVASCSLMAPACTLDLYRSHYRPRIGRAGGAGGIAALRQYNLIDRRERDDNVGPYRKSLLYFVSNAFEDRRAMPLLGLERAVQDLDLQAAHKIHYAGRAARITDSDTHGGFDNDRRTMNDILKTVLGRRPPVSKAFQPEEMCGY